MVRRNDPTIDEEALRQAIGRQSSHGSVLRTPEDPTTDDEPAPPPEAAASEACEPRRRRLRMPDYEQTFLCDHDVRHRSNLYASEEIRHRTHMLSLLEMQTVSSNLTEAKKIQAET